MVKRYISFIALCVVILLIAVVLSMPVKVEVHSVGEKPPFLFALLLLITLLVTAVLATYASYFAWFKEIKARSNIKNTIEQLANRYGYFRFLVITNVTFLFWFIRFTSPISALFSFGLFLLILFSAF